MKTLSNIKFLSILFLLGIVATSCVQDDDFDTPPIVFEEPQVDVNSSIQAAKDFYQGGAPALIQSGNPLYLEGYVVSSDQAGNFYKTLVIQNSPESPTAGISISTEATDMYTFFEPGRKVYVRIDGLYSGQFAGLPTLGVLNGTEIGRMSVAEFEERVLRSTEVEDLVPNIRVIGQTSSADLNTLVAFENVQVSDSDLGKPYGNLNNTFSVNRTIESCDNGAQITLRNSGFADFKNELMPQGSGTLTSVFSVFNNTFQLFIRDTQDVNFNQPRCASLLFEDFESITSTGNNAFISLPGWTNVNVTGGQERYEARSFSGNTYAQISAFGTGETNLEAWLVTPSLDLQGAQSSSLTFLTKDGFNNGNALKVYVSTDFTSDPLAATWTELNATIASGTSSGFASSFTSSGAIDLSAYAGQTIHIGFEYTGGSSSITTTYQIDNIRVTAQ